MATFTFNAKAAIVILFAGAVLFAFTPVTNAIRCYWNGNGPNDGTTTCYEDNDVAGIGQEESGGGTEVPPPPPPADDPPPAVTGEFTTVIEIDNDASHGSVYDTISRTQGPLSAGAYEDASVTYAFPSYGTWYYRTCTDTGAAIVESNEGNNCSSWQTITLNSPAVADVTADQLQIIQITGGMGALLQAVISNDGDASTNQ